MLKILATFQADPTLANAKKAIAYAKKHSFALCFMNQEQIDLLKTAERILEDAKNPAKTKEAMQRELQARFKNLNITVI